jgi:endonuclease YncB( thermonuclease family)
LKRIVGNARIDCAVASYDHDGVPLAVCRKYGRDIALKMLQVGWARVSTRVRANPQYLTEQRHAMAARYGMWKTYVLDMNEWRRRAVDKTVHRQPIADFNLLSKRRSEISPPFDDARHRPSRTDR